MSYNSDIACSLRNLEALMDNQSSDYTVIAENNSAWDPVYMWYAEMWSLADTASAVWRIQFITYDSNGWMTSLSWADWNSDFDNIRNNRAGLVYS